MRVDFAYQGRLVSLDGFEGDHITKLIERTGTFYELELLNHIAELAITGTIIDVGANIGNHSVYFGLFTSVEKVIAIEPYPPAAALLTHNIANNGLEDRVTQETCAIGAKTGYVDLLPGKRSNNGHTKVIPGNRVQLRRLDDIAGTEVVSAIKIDVEGYEADVLAGAMGIVTKQRPFLFIEALKRKNKRRLDEILEPLGYAATRTFSGAPTYAYVAAMSNKAR